MASQGEGPSLRNLPSVDRVLCTEPLPEILLRYERTHVTQLVRSVLIEARDDIRSGAFAPAVEDVALRVRERIRSQWERELTPVVNATGVILHTNLGRAPLSSDALSAMVDASAYSNLEYDLPTGARRSRQTLVEPVLQSLTGAEAALVTVNNAAAVHLVLASLARGKEVIISRGQAVEIGGGFRVPAILRGSGARLVEVGTTNRTRLEDYEEAITDQTAAILHVHPSNFRVVGFTEGVPLRSLAELCGARNILLLDDNGSGALLDTANFGLSHEPMPAESIAAGSDLVMFSGDKLVGGPQSGIIVGRKDLMQRLDRHQMARVLRPDKVLLAALAATLRAFLRGDAVATVPVWRMIATTCESLEQRCRQWTAAAAERGIQIEIQDGLSTVGGGSLPGETLPTRLLTLPRRVSASALRHSHPVVLSTTHEGYARLDLRTVEPSDDERILQVVVKIYHAATAVEKTVIHSTS